MIEDENITKISRLFDALGNPSRLKILLLIEKTNRPLHIEAVSKILKMDYAAVYRHVNVLKERSLIEVYEVGRSRVLSLKKAEYIKQIMNIANKIIQ